jgi:hypothetical protein
VISERATDCGAICGIALDDGQVGDGRRCTREAGWSDHRRELGRGANYADDGVVVREEGGEGGGGLGYRLRRGGRGVA